MVSLRSLSRAGDSAAVLNVAAIDSHHHFWKFNPPDYEWIDESMAPLRQDFLCTQLNQATADLDVGGVISVQARTCVEETEFLLAEADRCPAVKGVVGWAPLKGAPGLGDLLDSWLDSTLLVCGGGITSSGSVE